MDIVETLDAIREIDKLTRDNPAILLLLKEMKEQEKAMPIISDGFVTLQRAAEILGCSKNYVGTLVEKKLLPCWILPGQSSRKFKISDLHKFMANRCRREGGTA